MFYPTRSDKHKFIMCTNGKCASTTMKHWYCAIHNMPAKCIWTCHNNLQYNDARFKVDAAEFNAHPYYKFIVVRNPWYRLVSFFSYWVLSQVYTEGMTLANTFEDLVHALHRNGGPRDTHTQLQTKGFRDPEHCFDAIVHVETLATDMEQVCRDCDIPYDPALFEKKLTISKTSKQSDADFVAQHGPAWKLPAKNFIKDGIPHWKLFYNQELLDLVSSMYQQDIQVLGYSAAHVFQDFEVPSASG